MADPRDEVAALLKELRDALEWMINLACGVGRAGGPPEDGEWQAAIDAGKLALTARSVVARESSCGDEGHPLTCNCYPDAARSPRQEPQHEEAPRPRISTRVRRAAVYAITPFPAAPLHGVPWREGK